VEGHGSTARLLLNNNTLYGTNVGGGPFGNGTIFAVDTDGSNFRVLHQFDGTDGSNPRGSLTLFGSRLFGTAHARGSFNDGTLFSLETDGSDFQILHHFQDRPDGRNSNSPPIEVGSRLYGTTVGGGNGGGVLYAINPDGSDYEIVFSFNGSTGLFPGGLLRIGDRFYVQNAAFGTGPFVSGAVISIGIDGADPTVLRAFDAFAEGSLGSNELVTDGNRLFGVAVNAGPNGEGAAFAMDLDGGNFELLHAFAGPPDGDLIRAPLIYLNGSVYGVAAFGGIEGSGVIYAITVPEPSALALISGAAVFALCVLSIATWRAKGDDDATTKDDAARGATTRS
jgi:uncharacterized repeat protein (TIGR03803 family)